MADQGMIAGIALEKTRFSFDKLYQYALPKGITVEAGMRVLVPFGRGNQPRMGLVMELSTLSNYHGGKLKEILSVVDEKPLLDEEGLFLIRALKELTFCCIFDAFRAMIPPGIGIQRKEGICGVKKEPLPPLSEQAGQLYHALMKKGKLCDGVQLLARLGIQGDEAIRELQSLGLLTKGQLLKRKIGDQRAVMARLVQDTAHELLTPKQQDVVDFLIAGDASVKEICYFCGVGKTVVENLQKKGTLELYEEIVYREVEKPTQQRKDPVQLSPHQQKAYEEIKGILDSGKSSATLLYGVTGSGKTQVFIRLIADTLAKGRGVIVLVPEIALTPQTVAEFTSRFGDRVAVMHSALSMGERLDEWRKIKDGICDVVIGTRTAVFAPVKNPGLIVIDEEQEHTYQSESNPRYHAREIALLRAKRAKGGVLLCSATPSVESYYHATNGRYHLVELTHRYALSGLPPVVTIDMNLAQKMEGSSIISQELGDALQNRLDKGEQSILLLNRRGYHTMIRCSVCQTVVKCPHCSVALTYHQVTGQLLCHYCGYTQPSEGRCSYCKQPLTARMGIGTQRVEQELRQCFPKARILRMDMDTTMTKHAHQRQFDAFAGGEYDIMVGTQMVAKGLNFPRVTLVGVLAADQSLYNEDFRAYERTFSLLTQVVGRCGRAELPGLAYVQTYTPDNGVIALAQQQNYPGYYSMELPFRQGGLYPPYCDLFEIGFSHESEDQVLEGALAFGELFGQLAKQHYPHLPFRLLGPAESAIYKQADRYRMQYLLKCRNNKETRALIQMVLMQYDKGDHAPCTIEPNG